MKSRVSRQSQILPALVRFMVILLVVVGLGLYGGGGWFFSDEIKADVLDVDPWEGGPNVRVTAASPETIALDAADDATVRDDGWYGVTWDDGAGLAGPIVESVGSSVVREFVPLTGDTLTTGDIVDFDPWVWVDPEQGLGLAFTEVVYESPLGEMMAWEIAGESDDWLITVHGKGADKREGLRLASIANSLGLNVLLIDYRNDPGNPADPSGSYQYGLTEWEDLEGAVRYVGSRRADEVTVAGMSTGAAIAFSFLYQSTLAQEVDRLILDAPNLVMEQTIRHGAEQRDLPVVGLPVPDSLATAAMWLAERRFDIEFAAWNYLDDRVELLDVPILAIHGVRDATVPLSVSADLAVARPDLVRYEEFPDADHVASWNRDRERYTEVVTTFLTGEVADEG